ncbi:hypothetical protein QTP88_025812 [Uroleucon formosanum]
MKQYKLVRNYILNNILDASLKLYLLFTTYYGLVIFNWILSIVTLLKYICDYILYTYAHLNQCIYIYTNTARYSPIQFMIFMAKLFVSFRRS